MTSSPLLSIEAITKRYADIAVLREVSFDARSGEIVAIVGENGAGKSTLMKILAGVIPAGEYEGRVRLGPEEITFRGPRDAHAAGIVMIPQELAVVPHLTVAENLMLNREPRRFGLIDVNGLEADARRILDDFEVDIDVRRRMAGLGIAARQLVEIAKALSRHARVLILDEPTASLSNTELEHLFQRLRGLRERGYLRLYISHRIDEVLAIADRVVVLRDGELVGVEPVGSASRDGLVQMMLGRSMGDLFPVIEPPRDPTVLRVAHLGVVDATNPARSAVDDVSFEIRTGEILGVFGLVGSGRTELVATLFGAPPGPWSGSVIVNGSVVHIRSPRDAIAVGLALVTEDRRRYGYVPEFGFTKNVTLGNLPSVSRRGWLDAICEETIGTASASELRLRAASLKQPVRSLSGGNQQKVVVGKWLATNPVVLMLDEPTRGIDVGAKADMYALLAALTRRGLGILLISSEASEVVGLAHRVLIMSRARIVAERGQGVTETELMRLASGSAEVHPTAA